MYCCKVVLSYLRDTDLTVDLKALQDDLQSNILSYEENRTQDSSSSIEDKTVTVEANKRKISFVYQEENFTDIGYELLNSFSHYKLSPFISYNRNAILRFILLPPSKVYFNGPLILVCTFDRSFIPPERTSMPNPFGMSNL